MANYDIESPERTSDSAKCKYSLNSEELQECLRIILALGTNYRGGIFNKIVMTFLQQITLTLKSSTSYLLTVQQ